MFDITEAGRQKIQIIHECKLGGINEGQVEAYAASLKLLYFYKYFHNRSGSRQVLEYEADAVTCRVSNRWMQLFFQT